MGDINSTRLPKLIPRKNAFKATLENLLSDIIPLPLDHFMQPFLMSINFLISSDYTISNESFPMSPSASRDDLRDRFYASRLSPATRPLCADGRKNRNFKLVHLDSTFLFFHSAGSRARQ